MKKTFINISKLVFTFLQLNCFVTALYAQTYVSSQPHEGKITALLPQKSTENSEGSFFSAGDDGFLIKWNANGLGEHYQIGTLNISKVSQNPLNNEVAICETDGVALNRISVLNWKTSEKKYSNRFKENITCLQYSAQGNYLIVGTATVNGVYILNARTGSVIKNIKDISSIITMAVTGDSEKTAVLYSPSGYLYYYDLKKGSVIAKFQTEASLEQPIIFGSGKLKDRFFAGVKRNTIYIIDAVTGKNVAQYDATSPLIFTGNSDAADGLYYVCSTGKAFNLRVIKDESLAPLIKKASGSTQESKTLKTFMGLKSGDSITSVAKNDASIFIGTKLGLIYKMSDVFESETYSLLPFSEKVFEKIYDIASSENDFYFLTENEIYQSSFKTSELKKIGVNSSQTNLFTYNNDIILWSRNTKKPVQRLTLSDGLDSFRVINLFTPKKTLQNVHLIDNKLVYVQGSTSVCVYNLDTTDNSELYTGTAIEDAVIDDSYIYIAKTALSNTDSPLISVNIKTGETAPIKINGYACYALNCQQDRTKGIYGISVKNQGGNSIITEVFAYSPEQKTVKTLLKIADEDTSAFADLYYPTLYTNLGKNQTYAYNIQTNKIMSYTRAHSLPQKVAVFKDELAMLNSDGSISWYVPSAQKQIETWRFTTDGRWQ